MDTNVLMSDVSTTKENNKDFSCKQTVYVVCGNTREFRKFQELYKSPSNITDVNFIYVIGPNSLSRRILQPNDVVKYYGTWNEKKGIEQIKKDVAKMKQWREFYKRYR